MPPKNSPITLHELLGQPTIILGMEPEELATFVLAHLVAIESGNNRGHLNRHNYSQGFRSQPQAVQQAIMEAWSWLGREGCLVAKPLGYLIHGSHSA